MKDDQDWSGVYPTAATFKWSAVPLPVRMGMPAKRGVPPHKYGNLELLKVGMMIDGGWCTGCVKKDTFVRLRKVNLVFSVTYLLNHNEVISLCTISLYTRNVVISNGCSLHMVVQDHVSAVPCKNSVSA